MYKGLKLPSANLTHHTIMVTIEKTQGHFQTSNINITTFFVQIIRNITQLNNKVPWHPFPLVKQNVQVIMNYQMAKKILQMTIKKFYKKISKTFQKALINETAWSVTLKNTQLIQYHPLAQERIQMCQNYLVHNHALKTVK